MRTSLRKYGYGERNEKDRADFLEQIKLVAKERLVYVDEAGIDNTIDYTYGYSLKGERFEDKKLGHRTQ